MHVQVQRQHAAISWKMKLTAHTNYNQIIYRKLPTYYARIVNYPLAFTKSHYCSSWKKSNAFRPLSLTIEIEKSLYSASILSKSQASVLSTQKSKVEAAHSLKTHTQCF